MVYPGSFCASAGSGGSGLSIRLGYIGPLLLSANERRLCALAAAAIAAEGCWLLYETV